MKIKVINKKYEEVLALPKAKRFKPMKQHLFFRIILRIASSFDLWAKISDGTKQENQRI